MGFMDKAKKLAEQAQTKLDEAQQQFNSQSSAPDGPAVEYDKHGRPMRPEQGASPPHGDPLGEAAESGGDPRREAAGSGAGSAGDSLGATPGMGTAPPAGAAPPSESPLAGERAVEPMAPPAPGPVSGSAPEDRNHESYAPPKLTSGDPLAG